MQKELRVKASSDVVARMIEGQVVIVPLVSGIGDAEDELYTLHDCQCRDKTPAILPVLPTRAAVSLGGDAVGTLQ